MSNILDYNVLKEFAIRNKLNFLAIYGSYYRGDNNINSDLDLIVESCNKLTCDKIDELENALSNILSIKVDIITPKLMILSHLTGYVWRLKEYKVIYGSPIIENQEYFQHNLLNITR